MKVFKNIISLAVFVVGAYQTVSVIDGAAILKLDGDALKLELRLIQTDKPPTPPTVGDVAKERQPPVNWGVVRPTAPSNAFPMYP